MAIINRDGTSEHDVSFTVYVNRDAWNKLVLDTTEKTVGNSSAEDVLVERLDTLFGMDKNGRPNAQCSPVV